MRLDKFTAEQTGVSRTDAKGLIRRKRVIVNGTAVTSPETAVDPETDEIIINGKKECYGRFLESHAIQAKRVAELLINNSYIFDKTSPFYMSMPNIRKMVNRYLQTKKSLSLDLKALIIKIKRFC